MSETSEMPTGVEVEENSAVKVARQAVRGVLETNEDWKKYRDSLQQKSVNTKDLSVYRAWVNAADAVVGSMRDIDRNSLGTKMYEMKMRVAAGAFQVASSTLDVAVNVLSWIPRKGLILGGAALFAINGVGAPLVAAGAVMERLVDGGFTRKIGFAWAARHATERIWKYKMVQGKETLKDMGGFAKEKTKQILGGFAENFAYPEGKPVKPPMAKV